MFTYPNDLYSHLQVEVEKLKARRSDCDTFELPSAQIVGQLLDVAYHASFLTEEGRAVAFSLAYSVPDGVRATQTRSFQDAKLVQFADKRDYSPTELVRLAAATNPQSTLIGVGPSGESNLAIWGLIHIGGAWQRLMDGQIGVLPPPPGTFNVSSTKPGELCCAVAHLTLLTLRNGSIIFPKMTLFKIRELKEFLAKTTTKLGQEELPKSTGDGTNMSLRINQMLEVQYRHRQFIERILHQMLRLNHGGALLLVESNEENLRTVKAHLSLKYEGTGDSILKLLTSSAQERAKATTIIMDNLHSTTPADKELEMKTAWQKADMICQALFDYADMMGTMSAVDGAVVATTELELLGFGAEITVKDSIGLQVRDMDSEKNVPLEAYGTRHRSAFRFLWHVPESVAFIVSQDGGLKFCRRVGNEIRLWQDVVIVSKDL